MEKGHINGEFESMKFDNLRPQYYEGIEIIKSLDYTIEDFIHHFPCFTGHLTLSRFLTFYEIYKKALGVAGHIAEIGVFRGASLLFFTKLVQLFESNSLTHSNAWGVLKQN